MRGHTDGVNGVAFFNDGHRVVTGSHDETLRIWDVEKGTLLGEPLQGHQGSVYSVAVSPDDKRIASGGQDNTVIIWDVESKQIAFKLVKHTGSVNCVCFSADGKRLASGSTDETVVIWDTKTAAVLTRLVVESLVAEGFWNAVFSVAFSTDGRKLACATWDGIIRVCHTNNAKLLLKFKAHDDVVRGIVWSPDGQQLISASNDKTVKFWNSSTGRQIGQPSGCTGHTDLISSLAIASDGSFIATAASDYTVRLWSTKTYQQMGQPLKHSNAVQCVAISSDGAMLASGSRDGDLYLWSIGNALQRQDGQEGYKEELEVEQQPRIREIQLLPTPPAESNTHERTNSSAAPPSLEISASSPQVEADSHSSVPTETILQDLTASITKIGDFPVASGGFGEVWKCIYQTDLGPTDVAVKSLLVYASDQTGEGMEKKTKRLRRELRICARLQHENILPVFGYTYGFGPLMAIVHPWAENGNLTMFLEREDSALRIVRRFKILVDITAGLQYLHANNVIHGDLTGPNVLIRGDGTACLADFGLSLMYSDVMTRSVASWTSTFHGNMRWLAPELLGDPEDERPVRPSKHSDVYSFGGIMLQVLTGKVPYHYLSEAAVIQRIGAGIKPLRACYPPLSDKCWRFIMICWSDVAESRPIAEELVEWIGAEFDLLSS